MAIFRFRYLLASVFFVVCGCGNSTNSEYPAQDSYDEASEPEEADENMLEVIGRPLLVPLGEDRSVSLTEESAEIYKESRWSRYELDNVKQRLDDIERHQRTQDVQRFSDQAFGK